MLNFAEARRVRTLLFINEEHLLFQGFETGLPQQNRHFAARRTFDKNFRRNAALRHHGLYPVDIQSTRRQMVNVASRKTDHVGN
ncbi:Uncharacterised protein [Salmonella enterica subsp. enterica serovar Bovismorbificans]|uniref:Uncharacterized protein n=1 Tax=Salmonella enterica subsp. enterica serovar Bovismorbificans TaxID=58097 RepID=A0A655BSM9_SALET|nr:Uncharacterised protein [Salmonella enterica subsp. enterica serovar Bovismorbificans]